MKRVLLGACALAAAFAMAVSAPSPAKAGGFSWGAFAGGATGAIVGNIITQKPTYGYNPPPTVVYQAPPPTYAGNCAPRYIAGAWCNVPACWKACGGTFASFSEYDCSVQKYGVPYRTRCEY